jgi:hypothetical protein
VHHGTVARVLAQAGLPRIGSASRPSRIDPYRPVFCVAGRQLPTTLGSMPPSRQRSPAACRPQRYGALTTTAGRRGMSRSSRATARELLFLQTIRTASSWRLPSWFCPARLTVLAQKWSAVKRPWSRDYKGVYEAPSSRILCKLLSFNTNSAQTPGGNWEGRTILNRLNNPVVRGANEEKALAALRSCGSWPSSCRMLKLRASMRRK